jgi:hypothetical protein
LNWCCRKRTAEEQEVGSSQVRKKPVKKKPAKKKKSPKKKKTPKKKKELKNAAAPPVQVVRSLLDMLNSGQ